MGTDADKQQNFVLPIWEDTGRWALDIQSNVLKQSFQATDHSELYPASLVERQLKLK